MHRPRENEKDMDWCTAFTNNDLKNDGTFS
jgi:hypothetical protein